MIAGKFSIDEMAAALQRAMGKVYLAAEQLGCSHQTVYNYIERHAELKEILDAERGKMVDTAEVALKKALLDGQAWAVCFTLKTLGRDRGYIERQEIHDERGLLNAVQIVLNVEHKPTLPERDGDGRGRLPAP